VKKVYAVKEGRKKGIFLSWSDCKEMIDGYSNASYKSFEDPYEAIDYLLDNYLHKENCEEKENKNQYVDRVMGNNQKIEAYVDGSFDAANATYGSGVVIIKDGEVIKKISHKGTNESNVSMRNVAGEIEGAMLAMKYAIDEGYRVLELYFDYNGIEKWCTGEWKVNKEGTIYYKQYYDSIKDMLRVNFHKVKAHTGIEYNELADKLAKESLL